MRNNQSQSASESTRYAEIAEFGEHPVKLPHEDLPELTEAEAIELLTIHAARCEDDADERMHTGFMFSLYAWNGKLNPENFRQVMACIKALGPSWSTGQVPSRTMANLWEMIYLGNYYLDNPSRIQQRKQWLGPNELDVEEEWLDCIGWAVMTFLQMNDAQAAFRLYNEHIAKQTALNSRNVNLE
jgi:hypothetical protein